MITAYPLQWPPGWPRAETRKRAQFSRYGNDLSVQDGTNRVLYELGQLGVTRDLVVISTNLRLRADGLPRSDGPQPQDVGAGVYWTERDQPSRCMAIDVYDRVADNLGAIASTLESLRKIERHGGAQILARAFSGFTALPAPGTLSSPWRTVLGLADDQRDLEAAERAYKRLRSAYHPDKPTGDAGKFRMVQAAWEQACRELKGAS